MLSSRKTGQAAVVIFFLVTALCEAARLGLGDGNLLRRSKEETCHACHKTDKNSPGDADAIKSHNSSVISSTQKWGGSWGVNGARYGEIGCTTCHIPHNTANIYLIRETIKTPDNTTWGSSGTDRVTADFRLKSGGVVGQVGLMGDDNVSHSTSTRVCEVCHSQNKYHNYNSSNNSGGLDHNNATDCTTCHSHKSGFAHSAGSGTGCITCHGHSSGFEYETGKYSQGRGSAHSHATHTEHSGTHLKGPSPALVCGDCHNTNNFPYFSDNKTLSQTTVCNNCHSEGGTYKGVSDAQIGAKSNWRTGIYNNSDNKTLLAGKEKWCATCHDESPSVISGINAPNVVGDESGAYTYGTGWGFYKTGHGLSSGEKYPASGGVTAGAGKTCVDCHDASTSHIDGLARTYEDNDSSSIDPSSYRIGYRLRTVAAGQGTGSSTQEPMLMPWPVTVSNNANNYRLCMTCHNSGPFMGTDNNTNMRSSTYNLHAYHLTHGANRFPSDWSGSLNSNITCITCHNVHGTTRLAMVQDGKLNNREPGFRIWYYNSDIVSYTHMSTNDPAPTNLPLTASTGSVYVGESAANLCTHCHANGQTNVISRTPFNSGLAKAPVLLWTGEAGYVSDGVNPDNGSAGTNFTFRVKYTDANNNAPLKIQVWVDKNDDGSYDNATEMFDMSPAYSDTNYTAGKIYTATLQLAKAGDNQLKFRFYAQDNTSLTATGDPTLDNQTVLITNSQPRLSWTGETSYTGSGVSPSTGGNGASFEFRIKYTDLDNTSPSAIQVWVDTNDNGIYEAGEKFDMAKASGQGSDYTNGVIYFKALNISYAGDGNIKYRFYASDGTDNATLDAGPVGDSELTVLSSSGNTPPTLAWDTGAACLTGGVRPREGADNGTFEFRVRYLDWDNNSPSVIQVWVDVNDNGVYDSGEKFDMAVVSGQGSDYRNGVVYFKKLNIPYAGDGDLKYRFYAVDSDNATATGSPVSDSTLTVRNALKVRPEGGTGWYSTIASAITASADNSTILVYPYDNMTAATYGNITFWNKSNRTVRSVCGADLTVISGYGSVAQAVVFQSGNNNILDGFSMTGGTSYGVYVLSTTTPPNVVKNSNVYGNPTGIYLNNAIPVTIDNCRIYSNTSRGISTGSSARLNMSNSEIYWNGNNAVQGAGIYMQGAVHTITNSVIRNNPQSDAASAGGGIYLQSTLAGTTIDNTTIKNNSAANGGGVYLNGSSVDFKKCVITGNSATGLGGAVNAGANTSGFENCVIADNQAPKGGGFYINSASAIMTFINNTFANNQATSTTGGVFDVCGYGTLTVRNSIFWNNTATGLGDNAYKECGAANFMTVSDSYISTTPGYIDGGTITSGNNTDATQDPLFVGSGNYHLQSGSQCRNAGNNDYAPADDIDGQTRPRSEGDPADMGADEYLP